MKKIIILLIVTLLCIISCASSFHIDENNIDYVPDEATAIKIAEAIWYPLYGESIYEKKPYKVNLINNKIWRVEGSIPKNEIGGVPIIEFQKKDGKILKVIHTK